MKLRRTTRAQRDLERIVSYISDIEHSPKIALSVLERIENVLEAIKDNPEIGFQGRRPLTREMPIHGLRTTIVYRVVGDTIEILTVFRSRQQPDKKYH
ncbi:MAG: type II toxin-antitoxin system RelE/ParE family toxin [Gammaproteobacteria bacterium]|nr:type II toxin-antitoxin system RelE/ParE family toxin [Gammaproteobacteria bacterium]